MEAVASLRDQYLLLKLGLGDVGACIDWAMERLQSNQEEGDLEVVLLAAATTHDDAFPLVAEIVERYCPIEALDDRVAAGKLISQLQDAYVTGKITIGEIDEQLTGLYLRLGYPEWLTMLARNCEYAVDVEPFRRPFEEELSYVAGLWASSESFAEFNSKYSRAVSNQHDVRDC